MSDEWERLYRKYQDELLDQAQRIAQMEAENVVLREIVGQLLIVPPYNICDNTDCFFHGDCYPEWEGPNADLGYWRHHPDCLVTQAQRLLGQSSK
jgi:hypothetical protein